jgi:hypothetical protein
MSAPVLKPVNSELVAVAWLQSIPGVPTGKTAMTLPPREAWQATGFVTVDGIVGGTPHPDAPIYRPVIQLGFWAANEGSSITPPWGSAFILSEYVKRATEVDSPHRSKVLTIPHGFEQALVRDVTVLTENRRHPVPSLESYAHVIMDVMLEWTIYRPEEYM